MRTEATNRTTKQVPQRNEGPARAADETTGGEETARLDAEPVEDGVSGGPGVENKTENTKRRWREVSHIKAHTRLTVSLHAPYGGDPACRAMRGSYGNTERDFAGILGIPGELGLHSISQTGGFL